MFPQKKSIIVRTGVRCIVAVQRSDRILASAVTGDMSDIPDQESGGEVKGQWGWRWGFFSSPVHKTVVVEKHVWVAELLKTASSL